jgi:hypothetical protein
MKSVRSRRRSETRNSAFDRQSKIKQLKTDKHEFTADINV